MRFLSPRWLFYLLLLPSLCFSAEPIEHFTLKNGLSTLIQPDHRAPIAVVMVWYSVGSADEPSGLTGISHMLEHMMFKGTPLFPAGQFSKTMAALGGQENAFTTADTTAYFERISAAHLKTALKLEADRMQRLLLSADEFSKELNVVKEERRLRTDNNPQAVALERFLAVAHLSAPYQHPVIGWMSDLNHLTVEDLRHWYQRYYTPAQATLVIVGDVQPTQVRRWVTRFFKKIPHRPAVAHRPQVEPPPLGPKRIDLSLPAQQPILLLGYTVPGLTYAPQPQDAYTLEVITGLLDAGENARLTRNLIRTQHLASTVDAYYDLYARFPSQFMLFAVPAPGHSLKPLKQALLAEIQQLNKHLVPQDELQRIKTQLIAQKIFSQDSLFNQAMQLGLLEAVGLGYQTAERYSAGIRAVTPEQIQKTAQRYFCQACLTEAYLHPTSSQESPHEPRS